jgi:chromosome segregation ATPase
MNSILVKLNVALQEAEVLIESLKKQKNDLGLSHALLDKGHEELKTKTADIAQRESVIEPIENIQLALKDIDKKNANIQDGLAKLSEAQKSFESYRTIETDRLNNLRISVTKENDNVVEGFKKLEQEKKNLEAEIDRRVKDFISKHVRS